MKFKISLLLASILLGCLLQQVSAQDLKVSGNVRNKINGEPLVGATVTIKGSSAVTTTDSKGDFSIVSPKGSRLVISYTGMKTVELSASRSGIGTTGRKRVHHVERCGGGRLRHPEDH